MVGLQEGTESRGRECPLILAIQILGFFNISFRNYFRLAKMASIIKRVLPYPIFTQIP